MVFLAVVSVPGSLITPLGTLTSFWHECPFPALPGCYLLFHLSVFLSLFLKKIPLLSEVGPHVGFSHFRLSFQLS